MNKPHILLDDIDQLVVVHSNGAFIEIPYDHDDQIKIAIERGPIFAPWYPSRYEWSKTRWVI